MLRGALRLGTALGLAALVCAPATAGAESALRLEPPAHFGVVPASTYDAERRKVGKAHLVLERLDDHHVRVFSESGFTAGPRTVMTGEFAPEDGNGGLLQPLLQESRSFRPDGTPMGLLSIDHRRGVASCSDGEGKLVAELELPAQDRVANLTLSLFFLPLVRGETEELSFQLFVCGGGARLIDFIASVAPGSRNGKRGNTVEVRYSPDFGIASMVAANFAPKLSVWFDPQAPYDWVAHRVPLYGSGPEVFVVREGIPTRWLAEE